LREKVHEQYQTFIRGLLDVTDNVTADGEVVAPPALRRVDGDDPYLVVAADRGTASFSDTANAISAEYGFWLGDAFASGGSRGYDHKALGITARGAWVAARRHFDEMGVDADADAVTAVGVGDMSGDVFGNGMLRSPHLRLVAAFDHRDIFVDPTPTRLPPSRSGAGSTRSRGRRGRTTTGRRSAPAGECGLGRRSRCHCRQRRGARSASTPSS
jgi:glutamate dehydrogenase